MTPVLRNELCRKHGVSCMFWCRLEEGHPGLCENGVCYSPELFKGDREDLDHDLLALAKEIKAVTTCEHGRSSATWRKEMVKAKFLTCALLKRLEWWRKKEEEEDNRLETLKESL